ncbi:MAG: helix-turn-helix transcriptional regulator [Magnetococcales bacterium]|nr:helix-turn-helix transcriptional regulator [Magnetococcales bacterium]
MGLVRKTGIAYGSATKYLSGGTPNIENVIKISDAYGVSLDWLLTGEGPMRREDVIPLPNPGELEDFVMVPRRDVHASAGHGSLVHSEHRIVERHAFRREWFIGRMGLSEQESDLILVEGDSMFPTLSDGDMVLVDRRIQTLRGDAVYVIRIEDELRIKRVCRHLDGSLHVKSDNPVYQEQVIPPGGNGTALHIVGKVVWAGRRM